MFSLRADTIADGTGRHKRVAFIHKKDVRILPCAVPVMLVVGSGKNYIDGETFSLSGSPRSRMERPGGIRLPVTASTISVICRRSTFGKVPSTNLCRIVNKTALWSACTGMKLVKDTTPRKNIRWNMA